MSFRLDQDMHVHSQFSDGVHTIEENLAQAARAGLRRLGCVDHVRSGTNWIPEFTQEVARLRRTTNIELCAGVESKILDASGALDLPQSLDGVDFIFAADHQFPLNDGCHPPQVIRELMASGTFSAEELIESLVRTTQRTIERYPNLVLAHLFSVLPKLRLNEKLIPESLLDDLAITAARHGAVVEIDERWRCPSLRTARAMSRRGVRLVASSDSHTRGSIGQYSYVRDLAFALGEHS